MKTYVHLVMFKTIYQEIILGAWHNRGAAKRFADDYGYILKPEDGGCAHPEGEAYVTSVDYHDEVVAGEGIEPT